MKIQLCEKIKFKQIQIDVQREKELWWYIQVPWDKMQFLLLILI